MSGGASRIYRVDCFTIDLMRMKLLSNDTGGQFLGHRENLIKGIWIFKMKIMILVIPAVILKYSALAGR